MAYVKGSIVRTPNDLVTILKAFVSANTTMSFEGNCITNDDTSPSFKSNDGVYFNFKFDATVIQTTLSETKPTGNITSGVNNSNAQDGFTTAKTTNFKYPIRAHHLFTDGNVVIMVLETVSGVFRHHAFGKLSSFDNLNGGHFAGGTQTASLSYQLTSDRIFSDEEWTDVYKYSHPFTYGFTNGSPGTTMLRARNFIRLDGKYIPYMINDDITGTFPNNTKFVLRNQYLYGKGLNNYNARAQLYPVVYYLSNQPGIPSFHMKPCFFAPNVALVDVYGFNQEDVLNNEWVVFPLTSKIKTLSKDVSSGNYGVAYKK